MNIRCLILVMIIAAGVQAEENRTVEQTLSNLANIVIPRVDFKDDTTVEDAIDYLNIALRAPDPPPPKHWIIRLDVPRPIMKKKVTLEGNNLNLHAILGRIADAIDAEVVVSRNGITIRQQNK